MPSPRIVGTSRKQGQGKMRRARYGKGGSAFSLLSSQRVICISFHIAEHYSLEPGTGYLSCDKNGNFVAAPYCERYQATFTSIHVQYSPLVQVLKPSSTSRRKGCTGKQFTDYKSMRIKIILQCLKSKIYKHLKFWITELILLNYTVRRMLKILWKFLNWTLKIVS